MVGPGTESSWKVIALCFLGATIFWFFNALNKDYAARIKYPISFEYNSDETIVVDPLPEEVRLEVRGGGWNLLRKTFWFNVQPVQISLSEPTETKFLTSNMLKPIFVDQVSEIRIDEVLVDTLFVNIEKKISRTLPVIIDSSNIRLAREHRIVSPIQLSSDTIQVTGPLSQVNAIGQSIMITLNKEVINKDLSEEISIDAYLPSKVFSDPSTITVSFSVQQFMIVDKEVMIETINFPENGKIHLRDSTITASVLIARNNLEQLNTSQIKIIADYRRLNQRDSTIRLRVTDFPEFIADVNLRADSIKIEYED